jgi:hypothetical protein
MRPVTTGHAPLLPERHPAKPLVDFAGKSRGCFAGGYGFLPLHRCGRGDYNGFTTWSLQT